MHQAFTRSKKYDFEKFPAELWKWDSGQIVAAIKDGHVSSREVVQAILERIDVVNPKLNAIAPVDRNVALAAADRIDSARRNNEQLGPLCGVPITVKENCDQEGYATTSGFVACKDLIAKTNNPAVEGLQRDGAILVGRSFLPEAGMRWHTKSSLRGATMNPWHRDRTPGGSSGGSAVAVATGMGPLAVGGDIGGSIRFPAHCCGITGLRPSRARMATHNDSALMDKAAGSMLMAVPGPMARCIADLRLGLASMAAVDPRDSRSAPVPLQLEGIKRPIRVALAPNPSGQGVHPDVAAAVRQAGETLADAGYDVVEIEPPSVEAAANTWLAVVGNELRHLMLPAYKKLGDNETIRFLDLWMETVPDLDIVGYAKALSEMFKHQRAWDLFLQEYPLVLMPVSTQPAFEVGYDIASVANVKELSIAQRVQMAIPLLDLPAVSVPVCISNGLPIGVEVVGRRYREDTCLDAAEAIELCHKLPTPIDPKW